MSESYETKLQQFVDGRTFIRLTKPIRNHADMYCDACGSLEPRNLYGLKEQDSERYFFVGSECLKWICQHGGVERRFCRENGLKAFEREIERRQAENNNDIENRATLHNIDNGSMHFIFSGNSFS